jgi:hypothetical protein
LPRSGRRPDITEAARAWLIGEASAKPKERAYPHELWTLPLLAAHAPLPRPDSGSYLPGSAGAQHGPRHPKQATGQAHKVRYYLDRRDPAFDERKAEVIEVYAAAEMMRAPPETERPVAILS